MQTLDVISVNLWQILASLLNLVLLFLIVKKFLYKPVKTMLADRQNAIEKDYDDAKKARAEALLEKETYENQIKNAKNEANNIIKSATDDANARSDEIISEAKMRADMIVNAAKVDAELEMKKAESTIKEEIVEVSSLLAEKMLRREISKEDHRELIDSFIESVGNENERDV